MKLTIPVVIWAPPFNPLSGGVLVLHKLCDLLRKRGVDAYLSKDARNKLCPEYQTPIFSCNVKDYIVIYPEVVYGNPLGGRYVVRWLLNSPGFFGTPFKAEPNDIIITFTEKFSKNYPNCHKLCFFEWRDDVFNNYNNDNIRSGSCYTYRKARHQHKKRISQTAGQVEITNQNAIEMAKIFRAKEVFYSYDSATFLSLQAAMCGCTSIVIPDDNLSKEEWINGLPYFKYGIAYGIDDIAHAKNTQLLIKGHLASINKESSVQLDDFINRLDKIEKRFILLNSLSQAN